MLIIDGHEDLAYNVLACGRNYLQSALVTREHEAGGPVPEANGLCMLGLPEWLAAHVGIAVTTVTAIPHEQAHAGEPVYTTSEEAYQLGLKQLAIYQRWDAGNSPIRLVSHRAALEGVLDTWSESSEPVDRRIGLILLIENADLIRSPDEVEFWHGQGVRLIGPAWHTNRYIGSSMTGGTLTTLGCALLGKMQQFGIVLDLTHMSDEACREALGRYDGPIVASHTTPRRLGTGKRQWGHPQLAHRLLADDVMEELIARAGVIGIMPANWALDPNWKRSTFKADIHIGDVVDAIDIVCQTAGDARHVAIGTDFDGGFGAEATPAEIDTIADLQQLVPALLHRGYTHEDVEAVMHGNWLRILRRCLSD
jgi:membrane dipeptidase